MWVNELSVYKKAMDEYKYKAGYDEMNNSFQEEKKLLLKPVYLRLIIRNPEKSRKEKLKPLLNQKKPKRSKQYIYD
jgi:hypothetical protein